MSGSSRALPISAEVGIPAPSPAALPLENGSGPRVDVKPPPGSTSLSFGQKLISIIASSGITPNEMTIIGLLLVIVNCAAYVWHRNSFWLGFGLAMSFGFDALDGTIARFQGTQSAYGSYLDAVSDRCEEIATYFVLAWVNGWWIASFIAVTGSMLISYNKARTAMEIKVENKAWPDLLERHVRGWMICGGLICDVLVPVPAILGGHLIYVVLVALGPLTYIAAIQRFFRARQFLLSE
jgi:archaetidylinositol phosphate synthase